MKIDKRDEAAADAILEIEMNRVQTLVDTIKAGIASLGMTLLELQELATRQVAAVRQTYAQVHANYHNQFDASCEEGCCDASCLFAYAEKRFTDIMAVIVESITAGRTTLTAEEINALARKHGIVYH